MLMFVLFGLLLVLEAFGQPSCKLDPMFTSQIDNDFEPFREGITVQMLRRIKNLAKDYYQELQFCEVKVRNGVFNVQGSFYVCQMYQKYWPMITNEVQIGDIDFYLTCIDDPHFVKHRCQVCSKKMQPCDCDQGYEYPVHSYFWRRQVFKFSQKLPVFALTKINECFSDILVPSYYHTFNGTSDEKINALSIPKWQSKQFKLYWRGVISDFFRPKKRFEGTPFFSHRMRLLKFCKDIEECDAKTNDYFTMPKELITEELKKQYPISFTGYEQWVKYKILIDVDGATFSRRFVEVLKLGSVIFKMKTFEDIGSIAMRPWEHYVPVRMDFSDFKEKIQWAKEHDEEMKQIAERGRKRAFQIFNQETYKCYWLHLFWRYEQLQRKGGSLPEKNLNS